jgi:MFS family permease
MPEPVVSRPSVSGWSPFHYRAFTIIGIGTVVSDIGGWMCTSASGWLMTSPHSSPFIVAMIQVATSLPMCLLAIPAGALSDIVDRRKFLIFGELSIMAASVVFAVHVSRHMITPMSLLFMTFIVSVGSVAAAPPWQAAVNQLVAKAAQLHESRQRPMGRGSHTCAGRLAVMKQSVECAVDSAIWGGGL